jgi:folate-binding protein YgfZ
MSPDPMPDKIAVYTKLPDRAAIKVAGDDRLSFLQGLVTQDIDLLKSQDLIYSCLLTPNGKFLFDFFIVRYDDHLVIDCEGGERAETLFKRLTMFKLRSDIILELKPHLDVWQAFDGEHDGSYKDPRFDWYRAYTKPHDIDEVDFDDWDNYRIKTKVPDGSRDMIPEKSFLHESKVILDSGVSFTKGCYMGQELVSRMHHRGLIKKQLRCVDIDNIPEGSELRSSCGKIGLALVKL